MVNKHDLLKSAPLFVAACLGAILFFSCSDKPTTAASGPPAAPQVDVMIIHTDTFSYQTEANGTVLAQEFVELKSEVSGRVIRLNIHEGSFVEEGTLLLKLNDEDLQAQLRKYQSQLEIAEKTTERFKKLRDANGLNQQEYDQAVSAANSLHSDVDLVNAQIRKTEIRAPFSGIIGLRNVSVGALVTSQDVIANLQQVNTLKLDFVLPESLSARVKMGSTVKVKSGTGQILSARVIASEPQVSEGSRNMRFRAELQNAKDLNPGAFVNVIIESDQGNTSILIPTNCIIPESRNKRVALIKNGRVKFQVVETGFRGEENVQIISGLAIGDTLATSGLMFLKPDAPVNIRSVK